MLEAKQQKLDKSCKSRECLRISKVHLQILSGLTSEHNVIPNEGF